MRFVIYKNSILATFCSMFGAAFIVMAVTSMVSGELGILPGIGVIAAGLGLMFLAGYISERKAKKQREKARAAASNPGGTQSRQAAQTAQFSTYTAQAATVYPSEVRGKPVKKSAAFAGAFFLLAAMLEFIVLRIYLSQTPYFMLNSEQVAMVSMGALLTIAAFRTRHIQQVSVLYIIGFLGLTLGSVDVALNAYRAYGFDGYATGEGIYYAVVAAPALKAAAHFLMCVFALLSTRRIKESCGGIVRWLWFVPILLLILGYTKEIADDQSLWLFCHRLTQRSGFPGLKPLVHPLLLHVYAIAFLVLAVFLAGFCFQRLCRKRAVVYTRPEPQSAYAPPMQETPVQPQPEPRYVAPEPPKQPEPAPKTNDQDVQKQIQAYKDLLDCGILTQEECEQKIRELTQEYYGG